MDQMDLVGMAEGDILRAQVAGVTEPAIAYETPQTFDVDRGRGAGFLVTRIRHYKFVLFVRRRLALSSSIRLYRPTRDAGKDWLGHTPKATHRPEVQLSEYAVGWRLAQDLCRVNARRLH